MQIEKTWGAKSGVLVLAIACAVVGGCGDEGGGGPLDEGHGHQRVMVIDDGFDLSVPALSGKVIASYTVVCEPAAAPVDAGVAGAGKLLAAESADAGEADDAGESDAGVGSDVAGELDAGVAVDVVGAPVDARIGVDVPEATLDAGVQTDAGLSFADRLAALKKGMLSDLAKPDECCHLVPGIAPLPDPFADMAAQREGWNQVIATSAPSKSPIPTVTLMKLNEEIVKRLDKIDHHGTATASVIARDNNSVRLVLVQRTLRSMSDVVSTFTCIEQTDLDLTTALYGDAEVRAAFVARPPSSSDRELWQAAATHDVGVLSESYGAVARKTLESLNKMKGCTPVNMKAYYAAVGGVERAAEEAHAPAGVLVLKAAGNDGVEVKGPEDSFECWPGAQTRMLVGAYGLTMKRSTFSNFGDCVDLYGPGESVIGDVPGGWLLPFAGTSFSTPLAARALSQTGSAPFSVAKARQHLTSLLNPERQLTFKLFPSKLFFDRAGDVSRQPLVAADAQPDGGAQELQIDTAALERILRPVRWVAEHRR